MTESFTGHLIKHTSPYTGRETWILCSSNGPRKVDKIGAACFFLNHAEASFAKSDLAERWVIDREELSIHEGECVVSIGPSISRF